VDDQDLHRWADDGGRVPPPRDDDKDLSDWMAKLMREFVFQPAKDPPRRGHGTRGAYRRRNPRG
jgi:hypothetical protein